MDVRRERDRSGLIEYFFPYAFEFKSDYTVTALKDLFAFSFEFTGNKGHSFAFSYFLTGAGESFPVIIIYPFQKQEFYGTLCIGTYAEKSCRNYACVIYDEYIAFMKIISDVWEMTVNNFAGLFIKHKKT